VSVALLDVSVLIALFDRGHVRSGQVADWFSDNASSGWATCAITENGFVRIVSQPTYPQPIEASEAIARLRGACANPAHQFWACDLSVTEPSLLTPRRVLRSSQLTDIYLLALAVRHNGRFVTLDQRIGVDAVNGAAPDNLVVL